jgi:hypothetical protein
VCGGVTLHALTLSEITSHPHFLVKVQLFHIFINIIDLLCMPRLQNFKGFQNLPSDLLWML